MKKKMSQEFGWGKLLSTIWMLGLFVWSALLIALFVTFLIIGMVDTATAATLGANFTKLALYSLVVVVGLPTLYVLFAWAVWRKAPSVVIEWFTE